LEAEDVHATVELCGRQAQGMMVVDWRRDHCQTLNVQLIRALDLGKIQNFLATMVHAQAVVADVAISGNSMTLAEVYQSV
jgi:inosine-uridine nucleoside N-ribohydrolase